MDRNLILVPAYGRDYRSEADVRADVVAGKDFQISDVGCRWNGSYANLEQLVTDYDTVTVRYHRLRRVCVIRLVSLTPRPERTA